MQDRQPSNWIIIKSQTKSNFQNLEAAILPKLSLRNEFLGVTITCQPYRVVYDIVADDQNSLIEVSYDKGFPQSLLKALLAEDRESWGAKNTISKIFDMDSERQELESCISSLEKYYFSLSPNNPLTAVAAFNELRKFTDTPPRKWDAFNKMQQLLFTPAIRNETATVSTLNSNEAKGPK